MRVKVPMRYLTELFGVGKTELRVIFSEILGSDLINALERNYKNLEQLEMAQDSDIMTIPGMTDKKLKDMKEVLYGYYKDLTQKDELTKMPYNIPPARRLAYGELIEEAQLYSCSIKKIDKAIKKLPKQEKHFIKMSFGLNKQNHKKTQRKISEKLEIPVCELDEYKVKMFSHLRDILSD